MSIEGCFFSPLYSGITLWNCVRGGFVEVVCSFVQPPLCRLVHVLSPNRVSAVLPQSLAGIKGPSFLKGKQLSLCDHLLSPFFLCSSLRRQGAICLCPLSSHPNFLTRQKYLYISCLFLVCRHALRIISRNVSHDGKYLHLLCHSRKRQAFPG